MRMNYKYKDILYVEITVSDKITALEHLLKENQ